jgi:heparosan-N-sulfate-glucuronate 5-epimerase
MSGSYFDLARRSFQMVRGKSYWHMPQGLGKAFVPDRLDGYFNDLTHKAVWEGPVDARGLPLNNVRSGPPMLFPTTVIQFGLGHWDRWHLSHHSEKQAFDEALKVAQWAAESQDERGGWSVGPAVALAGLSPYSAMTQGEAVSLLVRLGAVTADDTYSRAARRAVECMLREVGDSGTVRNLGVGPILEEYPEGAEPNGILNGWIFALFGLYDFALSGADDGTAREMWESSLAALVALAQRYNRGYWSNYDLRGHIASPFYQDLHIAQLGALEMVCAAYSQQQLSHLRLTFESQRARGIDRMRAIAVKIQQKLKDPPTVVFS